MSEGHDEGIPRELIRTIKDAFMNTYFTDELHPNYVRKSLFKKI